MNELFTLLSFGPQGWGDELLSGTKLTILLALVTLPFGLFLGLGVALAKDSSRPWLVFFGNIYTTVFRGLPELLTLFIIYYGGQILLQNIVGFFAPNFYVEVNGFVAGVCALGLVFSAYASEVFVAALRAVSRGQTEAARALGISNIKTLWLVTLPQVWRYALPGLGNLWLVLLKDTALVSVIALNDLLRNTKIAVGNTKEPFFFYLVACLIYLILSIISSILLARLEAAAQKGERKAAI